MWIDNGILVIILQMYQKFSKLYGIQKKYTNLRGLYYLPVT